MEFFFFYLNLEFCVHKVELLNQFPMFYSLFHGNALHSA